MNHPNDVDYIRKMVPNISDEIVEKQKTLQPGTCLGFGMAFTIPLIVKLQMPNPEPKSGNCNVVNIWSGDMSPKQTLPSNIESNSNTIPNQKPPIVGRNEPQVVTPLFSNVGSSRDQKVEPLITVPIQTGAPSKQEPLITVPIQGSSTNSNLNIDEIIHGPDDL